MRSATSLETSLALEERRRIAAVRQRVLLVSLDLADVEEARLVGILGRDRLDQERRGLVLPHDVREVVHDVHRRFE